MSYVENRADNELIDRCLAGDENSWTDLISRYQRLVYSVAHTLCSQPEDVSDVFQQVWMELYTHLGNVRKIEALPARLVTVTRRRCYAMMNSRHGTEPLTDEIPDLSETLTHVEHEHTLERALDQLPD